MTKKKRTKLQIIGLASLSLIIAAASYGFAAGSSVPSASLLDVGYGVRSSYHVTGISYTLDEERPTYFTAVEFQVDQPVEAIAAGVSATRKGQVVWASDCQQTGSSWYCTFNRSINVLAADWLFVADVK